MVKRSQRLVALFAAVIILFEVAAVPQKAKAVALTASVVASVAAIMTACGVSYWAASQTDAIEYLGGKIDAYLGSLETVPQSYEDWLGIDAASQLFEVTASGTMRFASGVANKILDFVRSFNETEGVVSGGNPVGELGNGISYEASLGYHLGNTTGTYSVTDAGNGAIRVDLDGFGLTDANRTVALNILLKFPVTLNDDNYLRVEIVEGGYTSAFLKWGCWNDGFWTANDFASNGSYFNVGIRNEAAGTPYYLQLYVGNAQTASLVFRFSNVGTDDMSTPATAVVTPSPAVAVPEDLAEDDSFAVAPNVGLTQGMTVDQASDAVLGGVASEDGLTAEGEAVEGGAVSGWGWLSDILSAIHDFIAGIAQTVLGIPQAIGEAAQDIISGIRALPGMISDALTDLFVPDEAFVDTYVDSLMGLFEGRVGILTYPLALFVQFLNRFASIEDGDHTFRWGAIHEPFSGRQLIAAGSYDLDDAVASSPMSSVYSIYLIAVKAIVAFWFLHLCQKKYDQIINRH